MYKFLKNFENVLGKCVLHSSNQINITYSMNSVYFDCNFRERKKLAV